MTRAINKPYIDFLDMLLMELIGCKVTTKNHPN
jgi:hypothetical protein